MKVDSRLSSSEWIMMGAAEDRSTTGEFSKGDETLILASNCLYCKVPPRTRHYKSKRSPGLTCTSAVSELLHLGRSEPHMLLPKIFLLLCSIASCLAALSPRFSSNNHTMPYPTRSQIYSLLSLLSQPASDQFFAHVLDDVKWTVTGKSFLSGVWTTKASYRAATWAKIGALLKPPGIKLRITEGEEGIIVGQKGWATADLYTVDTYTNEGVRYDQAYAWHMRFDESGLIAEVKVWLDTLTLERVLGGEVTKQNMTRTTETEKKKE